MIMIIIENITKGYIQFYDYFCHSYGELTYFKEYLYNINHLNINILSKFLNMMIKGHPEKLLSVSKRKLLLLKDYISIEDCEKLILLHKNHNFSFYRLKNIKHAKIAKIKKVYKKYLNLTQLGNNKEKLIDLIISFTY